MEAVDSRGGGADERWRCRRWVCGGSSARLGCPVATIELIDVHVLQMCRPAKLRQKKEYELHRRPGLPTRICHCCKSVVVLKRSRIVNCFRLKLLFDIHARRASSGHRSVHFAAL